MHFPLKSQNFRTGFFNSKHLPASISPVHTPEQCLLWNSTGAPCLKWPHISGSYLSDLVVMKSEKQNRISPEHLVNFCYLKFDEHIRQT